MYPVSDAYLAARRSRVREERITGGIKLKDGTIIAVDDSVIIQNSLSVSKKVCSSGKFDIGTVNCSVLEMKLVDDSAYDHEFGGALIRLKYGIVTGVDENGNKVWEEVPLPPFFADGSEVTRKWNVVSITAYDPISLLNMDYPDTIPTTSLYAALGYVCARAGLGLAISEEEFNSLPNSSVIPDFSSSQIESCLDVAMWIAQTVNCCGFVDYRGLFDLKQYKYTGGNNYDRLFTEDEIKDIKYSDTRTYLAYLQAYVNGKVKLYSKVTAWTGTDASHTKEGALALPKNPILSKLTEEEQAAVNSSYLENRSYPTRYIKMTGWIDPALELMDVVAFSGKMIDVGQIINVATQIKWCYGKCGSIYCASVSENAEPSGGTSAVSLSSVTESDSSEIKRLQPKSQIQKRVDAIEAELKNSSGTAEKLQTSGSSIWADTAGNGFRDSFNIMSDKFQSEQVLKIYPNTDSTEGGFTIESSRGATITLGNDKIFICDIYNRNSVTIKSDSILIYRANNPNDDRIEITDDYTRIGSTSNGILRFKDGDTGLYTMVIICNDKRVEFDGSCLYINGKKVLTE